MNVHELRMLHERSWQHSYPQFIKVIDRFNLKVGVEVGVAFGGHAEAILDNTQVQRLVGIDPYQHQQNYDDMLNLPQEQFEHLFWYAMGRLSRFGERYTHVRLSSQEAAGNLEGFADFVYLDANHSYEAVKQDLASWLPRIRPGGIIAGHDFSLEFPGVRQAVEELAHQLKLHVTVEQASVWWGQLPSR